MQVNTVKAEITPMKVLKANFSKLNFIGRHKVYSITYNIHPSPILSRILTEAKEKIIAKKLLANVFKAIAREERINSIIRK